MIELLKASNRKILSQLDEFDQDINIESAANDRQGKLYSMKSTGDTNFTVGIFDLLYNENIKKVKTLKKCFVERIAREMSNYVETVKDRIQYASLTTIDGIVAPKIEILIKSINASSTRDATNVAANSERGEQIGISTPSENLCEKNITLFALKLNKDEVSELSVPRTQYSRQSHTHHIVTGQKAK